MCRMPFMPVRMSIQIGTLFFHAPMGALFQHVSAHLHKEAFNPFIELIENPGMTPVQTPGGPRFDNLSKLEKPFCAQASGAQTKFNRIRICLTA